MVLQSNQLNWIRVGRAYQIVLEESTTNNVKWEIKVPSGIQVTSGEYKMANYSHNVLIRTWTIEVGAPGNYVVTCSLRKMCCGKREIEKRTYEIVAE